MYSDIQKLRSTEKTADLLRLLSDPTRIRILKTLFAHPEGMCVYEIASAVGATPSATSHQLSKLERWSAVVCFREGQKICYELSTEPIVERIENVLEAAS